MAMGSAHEPDWRPSGTAPAAPFLLMLQGPPQRAIIVGMNEQGVALASRIQETRYSKIELSGYFDDRDPSRLYRDRK